MLDIMDNIDYIEWLWSIWNIVRLDFQVIEYGHMILDTAVWEKSMCKEGMP